MPIKKITESTCNEKNSQLQKQNAFLDKIPLHQEMIGPVPQEDAFSNSAQIIVNQMNIIPKLLGNLMLDKLMDKIELQKSQEFIANHEIKQLIIIRI